MNDIDIRGEATKFFDEFVFAFRSFDGSHIAQRYVTPYVALQTDGTIQYFTEHAAVGRYFQSVVDAYHAQGCRSCRYKDMQLVPLGDRCTLGTVTWELLREDGSVLSSWRESYNLLRTADGLKVFASVDHVA